MTTDHDFELLIDRTIPERNTRARLYRHAKTGAELLSLENDDENKVFGVTFRTPPTDSTGIFHILEHSVLCGSRKYPVKEPLVELLKGSLQTFVNAMTFPDKTSYPVASQNMQDFYNLVDVYLDAVFYPRITPYTLQQEGWHYELDDPGAPLTFKGVVFNEMKGAYSDPDGLLYQHIQSSLFPDNAYFVDSGGDPKVIPDLTYEQFERFHKTYYHPSNALVCFYGDDDPERRLRIMAEYFNAFERVEVDGKVALQPRFSEPRQAVHGYDAGTEDGGGQKTMVTVNWLLTETVDTELTFALEILGHILIGTPASPLRKALIDSGLGEDLAGAGMETSLRQIYFSTGLKGTSLEEAAKVEALVLDTLVSLAHTGIDPETVAASLNTIEFALRENNTGAYPRGLLLMLNALGNWLHGGDPLEPLAFEAPLSALKGRLAADSAYFEKLIAGHFLDNPHRTTVILTPEPGLREREDAAEQERLAQARAAMTPEALRQVVEDTRELKRRQETPDLPEALATIPGLKLSDLDQRNKVIPLDVLEAEGCRILYHDLFTNGIVYLDLGFNLYALPQEYLPYVSLFGRALLEMGTEQEDFVKLSQRIGSTTGGIRPSDFTSTVRQTDRGTAWLFLRGKATIAHADDLLAILREVLLDVRLDNQERFRQIVLEEKAIHEAGLVPGGHIVALTRLKAYFNEADWAAEQMGGVSYLFFLRQLAADIENNWPTVLAELETLRHLLVNRGAMICNVTLDQANWGQLESRLRGFLADLPAGQPVQTEWNPAYVAADEGLTIPAQVNYVGKGASLYQLGYQLHGSIRVIMNYLETTWLWERVRVHGGAYGGFCAFDHRSGVFGYVSYRDPNLLATLDNYDRASQFLRELDLSQEELVKSIIGAINLMDAYQLPDAKGYTSMQRYLAGDTNQSRQQMRDEVLSTTRADFGNFAEMLDRLNTHGRITVLGSQAAIGKASVGSRLRTLKVL